MYWTNAIALLRISSLRLSFMDVVVIISYHRSYLLIKSSLVMYQCTFADDVMLYMSTLQDACSLDDLGTKSPKSESKFIHSCIWHTGNILNELQYS